MSSMQSIIKRERNVSRKFDKSRKSTESVIKEVPQKIEMYFRENIDIVEIHDTVITKIENDTIYRKQYLDEIYFINIAIGGGSTDIDSLKCRRELLSDVIRTKYPENTMNDYLLRVNPILERYETLKPPIDQIRNIKSYIPSKLDLMRIEIITEFYRIASQYIHIDFYCTGQVPDFEEDVCKKCLNPLPVHDGMKLETRTCPSCYVVNTAVPKCRRFSKIDKNGMLTTRSDAIVTFIRALDFYEGKISNAQLTRDKLYENLDIYFKKNGIPCREEALGLPLDERGQRKGTNVQMMIRAFKGCKYEAYYEVYFVCADYWGYTPINISSIRDICIEDRKELIKVWDTISVNERERKSSISIWLWVWYHMRNRGHPCVLEDFKLPSEVQKSIILINKICDKCNNPNIKMPN